MSDPGAIVYRSDHKAVAERGAFTAGLLSIIALGSRLLRLLILLQLVGAGVVADQRDQSAQHHSSGSNGHPKASALQPFVGQVQVSKARSGDSVADKSGQPFCPSYTKTGEKQKRLCSLLGQHIGT